MESSSPTGNILHKNLGPQSNATIIQLNIALATRCGLFSNFSKTMPP